MFRLSIAFGVPARALADKLSADDLQFYQAYYALEPWGSKADDMRCALVAHTTHASNGGKASFVKFVPTWDTPKPLTYQQGSEVFMAWATQHNKNLRPGS